LAGGTPEFAQYGDASVAEQTGAQVFYLEQYFKREFAEVGQDRVHNIAYSDLCDNLKRELHALADFMRWHGYSASVARSGPVRFTQNTGQES
jgi:hypothetical protein